MKGHVYYSPELDVVVIKYLPTVDTRGAIEWDHNDLGYVLTNYYSSDTLSYNKDPFYEFKWYKVGNYHG